MSSAFSTFFDSLPDGSEYRGIGASSGIKHGWMLRLPMDTYNISDQKGTSDFSIVPLDCPISSAKLGLPPVGYIWIVVRRNHPNATAPPPFPAPPYSVWKTFIGPDGKRRDFILLPGHLFPDLHAYLYHRPAGIFEVKPLKKQDILVPQSTEQKTRAPVRVIGDSNVRPNTDVSTTTSTTTTAVKRQISDRQTSSSPHKCIRRIHAVIPDMVVVPRTDWESEGPVGEPDGRASPKMICRGRLYHNPETISNNIRSNRGIFICDGSCKCLGHIVNCTVRKTLRMTKILGLPRGIQVLSSTSLVGIDVSDLLASPSMNRFDRFDWMLVPRIAHIENLLSRERFIALPIAGDDKYYLVADVIGQHIPDSVLQPLPGAQRVAIDTSFLSHVVRPLSVDPNPRPMSFRIAAIPSEYVKTRLVAYFSH